MSIERLYYKNKGLLFIETHMVNILKLYMCKGLQISDEPRWSIDSNVYSLCILFFHLVFCLLLSPFVYLFLLRSRYFVSIFPPGMSLQVVSGEVVRTLYVNRGSKECQDVFLGRRYSYTEYYQLVLVWFFYFK